MPTCYRCRVEKEASAFIDRVDARHYKMCRDCVSEILSRRATGKRKLAHTASHRICYLCDRTLPVDRFTRRSNGTYFSACKDCNRHVFAQRRRARLAGAGGAYTHAEWTALVAQYEKCPRCLRRWEDIPARGGTVITADHIVPLARGGSNTIDNIEPLCYSCNSKKGVKLEPRARPL